MSKAILTLDHTNRPAEAAGGSITGQQPVENYIAMESENEQPVLVKKSVYDTMGNKRTIHVLTTKENSK